MQHDARNNLKDCALDREDRDEKVRKQLLKIIRIMIFLRF